MHTAVSS